MDKRYDVDDILQEIKRKKQSYSDDSYPPRSVSRPAASLEDREPAAPSRRASRWEEPEEAPAPRRASRWEEPEEAPAPRRASRWEEPEEAPAPRRASRWEEPEEAPAPRRASRWEEPEESPAPRRASRWEELEEAPAPRAAARREEEEEDLPHRRTRIAQRWNDGMDDFLNEEKPRRESRRERRRREQEQELELEESVPAIPPMEPADQGGESSSFHFEFVEDETGSQVEDVTRLDISMPEDEEPPVSFARSGAATTESPVRPPVQRAAAPAPRTKLGAFARPETDEDDEPLLLDEDALEYNSPADGREVAGELRSLRGGLLVRFGITLVCFLILVYLAFSYSYSLPLLSIIAPENNPTVYFAVNLAVMVVAAVACSNTIGGGLISFITFKADNDSYASLAVIVSLIQGAALVVSPDRYANTSVHLYLPVAALILVFNTLGKLFLSGRLVKGFRVVAAKGKKNIVRILKNQTLTREFARGLEVDEPQIAYSTRSGFLSNYLELAYSEDRSDGVARVMAPVCFFAGLVMSVVSYLFNRDIFVSLTVLGAVTCICSPLSAMLAANLPMALMASRLARNGGMIAGYSSVEKFSQANGAVVHCSDLFPRGSVVLNTIKVFQKNRIDEAILDAASVICSCDSPLTSIFTQMVGGHSEILKEAETVTYEDGMGLSAWVDGKRVLIGNRELMIHHNIEIPSIDYEQRYTEGEREIIYLSNSGELTAMYVLTYQANEEVEDVLSYMAARKMALVVYSTDPNLTPEKLSQVFGYPSQLIRIMPAKCHSEFDQAASDRETARAYIAHNGTFFSYIQALLSAKLCKSAVTLSTVMQICGVVIGFGLVTFFAFMQSMSTISMPAVLLYQLFWAVVIMIFPNLRRL